MAGKKQLNILKKGIEDWNKWRNDHPFVHIDLAGADLWNANLIRANLREADLTRAHLQKTNLWKADLWKADLREADLMGANLRNADLREANLTKADLKEADLREANFTGADLWEANLTKADLTGANFMRANLGESILVRTVLVEANLTQANLAVANLWEANLWKANLTGAYLFGAILAGADFTEANFLDSKIQRTTFANNNLSSSLGLERTHHGGPSTVGTDTIRKSKGKIPVEFLRGCGLSDMEIQSAKLAIPGLDPEQVAQITYEIHRLYCDQPIQFYSCFISYNSQDHSFAQRLHNDLQNNGVRCWFAPEDLKIGDEFRHTIGKQIRMKDKLLIILSRNSIRSEWVGDEVEKALAEEKEQGTHKLFPVRLDDAVLQAKDDWAEKIRLRRHIGDFSKDYAVAFQRLLRDLKPQ